MSWVLVKEACDLPPAWDQLAATNIFLTKRFLVHLQRTNPCKQTYNLLYVEDVLQAIYVDYVLQLDLLTYSRFCFTTPVRVLGIPCSVDKQGFACGQGYERAPLTHLQTKKGAKLLLNSDDALSDVPANTLPTCRLQLRWPTFDHYLAALRSHYRYRWQKARKKWAHVQVEVVAEPTFTAQMYTLYEQVFQQSHFKLEKLPFDFFQALPLPLTLIKASHADKLLGFVLLVENEDELIFFFTGFDYKLQSTYDTYHNLLLEILQYGIE
ncbi:MAG: GNAT family N-acetyltransferase, partial [Firmicutes bacterium]|nr:GNAT family N-acetyltransferase [Bacillota bacterium]